MMDNDLRAAVAALKGNVTLAFASGDDLILSEEAGIGFLYNAVASGKRLAGYAAADKVVGRASAFLMVSLGIKCIYAMTLSRGAAEVLDAYSIPYEYDVFAEEIINRKGTGRCPMEQATLDAQTPEEAFEALTRKFERDNQK